MAATIVTIDSILRGELPRPRTRQVIMIACGCGVAYGAVMGSLTGLPDGRTLQLLYSGLKVPMLLLVTFGIRSGTAIYFEAALVIALLGFVGTVALAKFLLRGEVIE